MNNGAKWGANLVKETVKKLLELEEERLESCNEQLMNYFEKDKTRYILEGKKSALEQIIKDLEIVLR